MTARIVSWNVAYRVGDAARRQGAFLASLGPDLVLLQEVNPRSADTVRSEAGLAWLVLSVDLRRPEPGDRPVRRRGVAIGGAGPEPLDACLLDGVPLPERILSVSVPAFGTTITAVSYHAPPGVNFGIKKVHQALRCADWLAAIANPAVMGADANTPEHDMPDFEQTRTHWHTGMRKLGGEPGDDVLFGPGKRHHLADALRTWFDDHPDEFERIRRDHPTGPLAVSHRTGRRLTSPGVDRRFDALWLTRHFRVHDVSYPYEASLAAGSDHSAVVADISRPA